MTRTTNYEHGMKFAGRLKCLQNKKFSYMSMHQFLQNLRQLFTSIDFGVIKYNTSPTAIFSLTSSLTFGEGRNSIISSKTYSERNNARHTSEEWCKKKNTWTTMKSCTQNRQ